MKKSHQEVIESIIKHDTAEARFFIKRQEEKLRILKEMERCKMENIIKVKKDEMVNLPKYATEGSSGFDLEASEPVTLYSDIPTLVHTGLYMSIPKDTEIQIRPRSGLALKDGITVLNTPGTIDEDYRGEICVCLIWNGYTSEGEKIPIRYETVNETKQTISVKHIDKGMKIAQAVLCPVLKAKFEVVDNLDDTERGDGGFGHTGVTTK